MAFSIRLTDEEKQLADSYAKLHAMSVGEAFKQALFEKIEDEYDVTVAEDVYKRQKSNFWSSRACRIFSMNLPGECGFEPPCNLRNLMLY